MILNTIEIKACKFHSKYEESCSINATNILKPFFNYINNKIFQFRFKTYFNRVLNYIT